MKRAALGLTIMFGLACVDNGPATTPPPRAEVLDSLARTVMLPTYAALETETAAFAITMQPLCERLDETTLAGAQAAWRTARDPLKRTEPFAFGPIDTLRIGAAIDFWPVREGDVEQAVAEMELPTPAYVEALGASRKGLPALEYLLFDPEAGDAAVLTRLDAGTSEGAHRCAYAVALAQNVAARATQLRAAWDPAGGNFVGELGAGEGGEVFPTVQLAVNELINRIIFALQDITDAKLGKPLGSNSGGTAMPDLLESRYADNGQADILATLQSVERLYLGADGELGLAHMVEPENRQLDQAIRVQVVAAQDAVAGLATPLRLAVVNDAALVEAARTEVRDLRQLFEVDAAGALGVIVTLNDNDGD